MKQLRMVIGWVFLIRGYAGWIVLDYQMDHIILSGLYSIPWIVSYRMDCIVLDGLYRIGWILSGNTGFYALAGYWLDVTDGTDGLDGTLVGQGWDGGTDVSRSQNGSATIGALTGSLPLSP